MRTPQFEFARRAGLFHPQVHTVAVEEEEKWEEGNKSENSFQSSQCFSPLDGALDSYHSVKCARTRVK